MIKQTDRISRRSALTGASLGSAAILAAPSVLRAQQTTSFQIGLSADTPETRGLAGRLSARVSALSDGAVVMQVGSVVGADAGLDKIGQGFDAVLGQGAHWMGTDPGFGLFSGTPFGMTIREFEAWVLADAGAFMLDALSEQNGVFAMLAGDLGPRPFGWANSAINSVADLSGKTVRAEGLAAMVLAAAGATVVPLDDGGSADIVQSNGLKTDLDAGLSGAFDRLYSDPVLNPHCAILMAWSRDTWLGLDEPVRALVAEAALAETDATLGAQTLREATAFAQMRSDNLAMEPLSPEFLAGLQDIAVTEMETVLERDSKWADAWFEYRYFLEDISAWTRISDGGYLLARAKVMGLDV